jgi:conjugal transfer pilin signal peptidase TrbI
MSLVQSWTDLPARNRKLALAVLVLAPLLYLATGMLADNFKKHVVLAYDQQRFGCLPWGLYTGLYQFDKVERGDLLAFKAASLPPLADGSVVIKVAAGQAGDVVEIKEGVLTINGRVMGDLRYGARRLNKPLTSWDKRYTIGPNEYFMLGSEYRSYDSRYWGVVKRENIIAKMHVVL